MTTVTIFAITFVFGVLRFLTITKEDKYLLKDPVELILTNTFMIKFDKDIEKTKGIIYIVLLLFSAIFHTLRAIGDKLMYLFLIMQVQYYVEFILKHFINKL